MADNNVRARLKGLLRETLEPSEIFPVGDDLALFTDRGDADSVSLLRLVMGLEREFGIVVNDADIQPDNFQNVSALVAFIERKLQ